MTYNDAKDEVYGIANTAILANVSLLAGAEFDMRWPGISKPGDAPPTDGYWGRAFFIAINAPQASLAKLNGVSRYAWLAQLFLQFYAPISLAGGLERCNLLAAAVNNAYANPSPSGLLSFTNPVVKEVGNNDTHYITNVTVICGFDEFK